MIELIVYADILIVLNLIVDYLLLKASALLLCANPRTIRLIFSSVLGAVSSLYIFIPYTSVFFEFLFRGLVCSTMSIVAFGYHSMKSFLKSSGILLFITCGYAGIMIAVWFIFKPKGMVINNGIVYFDISPVVLVLSTVVAYLVFILLFKVFGTTAKTAKRCRVSIFANHNKRDLNCILDSGNSVIDIFGKSEIIIADKSVLNDLFGELDISKNKQLSSRYRIVPCSTVSGNVVLDAYRCDKANVTVGEKTVTLEKPIVAVSKTKMSGEYEAVLNPNIFEFGD